jgi:hypothetical protein
VKAIVTCYGEDADPINANQFTLFAKVVFVGSDVPGSVLNGNGADGRGVPVNLNITQLAQYPNNVEDALIADAARLGIIIGRTDCLFPDYQRGA